MRVDAFFCEDRNMVIVVFARADAGGYTKLYCDAKMDRYLQK